MLYHTSAPVGRAACSHPARPRALPLSAAPGRLRVQRCTAVPEDTPEPATDSDGFGSALRKGFMPRQAAPTPQPASTSQQGPDGIGRIVGNNIVFGADDMSETAWRQIDKKLNRYPGYRTFTAIGSGGNDFKVAMIKAVEEVVGTVHQECVSQRPSSKGAYLSVKVGPVRVQSPEEVIAIFGNMRKDERIKWLW